MMRSSVWPSVAWTTGRPAGAVAKGQLLEKRRCEKEEDAGAGRRDTYQPYFFSEETVYSLKKSVNNTF
jgi:hypothetical protein